MNRFFLFGPEERARQERGAQNQGEMRDLQDRARVSPPKGG